MKPSHRNVVLNSSPFDTVPLTFTRASVAYTWDGIPLPQNTPRLEYLINGTLERGCLIEQAHSNYDTADESQHPTYSGTGSTPPTVDNDSTEYQLFGDHSCKIKFNIVSPDIGDGAAAPNVPFNHPDGATLTYMVWIYSETSFNVALVITGDAYLGSSNINVVPGLNVYPVTVTNSTGSSKSVGPYFYNASELATMYVCGRQIVDAPFPLSWTLGGTTQAKETLTSPSTVLNIDTSGGTPNQTTGTIELEVYLPDLAMDKGIGYILTKRDSANHNGILLVSYYSGGQRITMLTEDDTSSSEVYFLETVGNGWFKIVSGFDEGLLTLCKDGVIQQSVENPKLPMNRENDIYIGSSWLGYNQLNSLVRNVTISRPKRTDSDITLRNSRNVDGSGFGVDRQVSLVAPLMHDLRAYKVRT